MITTILLPAGNVSKLYFRVFNTDNEKPVIFGMPGNIIKQSGHPSVAVDWTEPTATDNSGIQTLVASHSPGSKFSVGSTPVVYSSSDPSGNVEMQNFVVIVKGKVILSLFKCKMYLLRKSSSTISSRP